MDKPTNSAVLAWTLAEIIDRATSGPEEVDRDGLAHLILDLLDAHAKEREIAASRKHGGCDDS